MNEQTSKSATLNGNPLLTLKPTLPKLRRKSLCLSVAGDKNAVFFPISRRHWRILIVNTNILA